LKNGAVHHADRAATGGDHTLPVVLLQTMIPLEELLERLVEIVF